MRDPARIDRLCELLRVAWHGVPDQRFGQLVNNLHSVLKDSAIFHVEDDVWERKLRVLATDGFYAARETK